MNIVASIISWLIGKVFEFALFTVWLTLYLAAVLIKAGIWAASGGKSDAPILVWNHPKAVAKLLAPDETETLLYCGRGGWKHKMYRYYLSQVVYVYVTHQRILIVSKNHGTHEFNLHDVQLATDESIGQLHLSDPSHEVNLGLVPAEGIQAVVSAVNRSRNSDRAV